MFLISSLVFTISGFNVSEGMSPELNMRSPLFNFGFNAPPPPISTISVIFPEFSFFIIVGFGILIFLPQPTKKKVMSCPA